MIAYNLLTLIAFFFFLYKSWLYIPKILLVSYLSDTFGQKPCIICQKYQLQNFTFPDLTIIPKIFILSYMSDDFGQKLCIICQKISTSKFDLSWPHNDLSSRIWPQSRFNWSFYSSQLYSTSKMTHKTCVTSPFFAMEFFFFIFWPCFEKSKK